MITDARYATMAHCIQELSRGRIEAIDDLAKERARSAKLVQALEEIREWDGGYTSPLELRRCAEEALATYRAELETKVPLI